jgi:hypothetical protein
MIRCGAVLVVLMLAVRPCVCESKPKPFSQQNVDTLFTLPNDACAGKWKPFIRGTIWLDDQHLAVGRSMYCEGDRRASGVLVEQAGVLSTQGNFSVFPQDGLKDVTKGPSGTILLNLREKVELLDINLHLMRTIPCKESGQCEVYVPNDMTDSDFAVCTTYKPEQMCSFYKGKDALIVRDGEVHAMLNGVIPQTPYPEFHAPAGASQFGKQPAWTVHDLDLWYFVNGRQLHIREKDGSDIEIPLPIKKSDAPGGCEGAVASQSIPPRFLATCNGASFYTDGDLDWLFGFSKVFVIDTASHQVVFDLPGSIGTNAGISPSGKTLFTLREDILSLYKLP